MPKHIKKPNMQKTAIHGHLVDGRSTYQTFCQWCEECGDELYPDFYGVLSQAGSDGIDMDSTSLNGIPYKDVSEIDRQLSDNGYYEENWVNCHSYLYHKPKATYLEWFIQKFQNPEIN